jgi:hypothetical protein
VIAQRIKRLPAITVKLGQNPNMKLSSMHDIGGCRAVMRNVSLVEKLVKRYEDATAKNPRRGGVFQRKYDYIAQPKSSGYRSVHLVYKFTSDSKHLRIFNDLRIEVQIRSRLQHAWATAVETVSMFTGQALKSNIGEESWKRFFALASSTFAHLERRPMVPGTPSDIVAVKVELSRFKQHLDMLNSFSTALQHFDKKAGYLYLMVLDPTARSVVVSTFDRDQTGPAQEEYLRIEKEIASARTQQEQAKQAVLVSVDSFSLLQKAYPNYFLDIRDFHATLSKVLAVGASS